MNLIGTQYTLLVNIELIVGKWISDKANYLAIGEPLDLQEVRIQNIYWYILCILAVKHI